VSEIYAGKSNSHRRRVKPRIHPQPGANLYSALAIVLGLVRKRIVDLAHGRIP